MTQSNWVEQNYRLPDDFEQAFNIEVEHPRHIPLLVEIVAELGEEYPVVAGLDHREQKHSEEYLPEEYDGKHAMRGINEELGNSLDPGVNLFRRSDSGNTVYTDDSKYCEIIALPVKETDQKRATELTDWYFENLTDSIQQSHDDSQIYSEDRDIYADNNQIIGTATKFRDNSATVRSYWAEEIPDIYSLMFQDNASWGELMEHRDNMKTSAEILGENSFYDRRMSDHQTRAMKSTDFMQEYGELADTSLPYNLLEREGGVPSKICFTE